MNNTIQDDIRHLKELVEKILEKESIIKSGNTLEFGSDSKYTCILLKGEKTKELVEKILAKENR